MSTKNYRRGPRKQKWTHHGLKPRDRPVEDTRLREWMLENDWSALALAKEWGVDKMTLLNWVNGQIIPALVWAFKIEKATAGQVPASSWLSTEMAKMRWQAEGSAVTK